MVLVRASTFGQMLVGGATPRALIGASGIVLAQRGRMTWSKKSVIAKNAPYTIEAPHPRQIEMRIAFGTIASQAKGSRGLDTATGLPHAAARIKAAKGTFSLTKPKAPPTRKSFHTIEELKKML
ncbi:MAG: hypothetical protein QXQ64_06155 [Candidatus Bathyarchaeia archaeon]